MFWKNTVLAPRPRRAPSPRPQAGRRRSGCLEREWLIRRYALHKTEYATPMNTIEMFLISIFIVLTPVLLLFVVRER
jgi:hypothetical protein